jgi:2,3-bisphosphoglycerate-independent phosphoglycerate mutase
LRKAVDSKIVLIATDGLVGLRGRTGEFAGVERDWVLDLDALVRRGEKDMPHPVSAGISCGTGPARLALAGCTALRRRIGRGVLWTLGLKFDSQEDEVTARGDCCAVDEGGKIGNGRRDATQTTERNLFLARSGPLISASATRPDILRLNPLCYLNPAGYLLQ